MPTIPALDSNPEQEAFAEVIGVSYVRVKDLNAEERAALKEVYYRARERLGVNEQLRRLGYRVADHEVTGLSKKLAAATAMTALGLLWWRGNK